jgi:hypothetical protein
VADAVDQQLTNAIASRTHRPLTPLGIPVSHLLNSS